MLFIFLKTSMSEFVIVAQMCPNSLQPHGLEPARLLSMEFYRQEYWSGLPFPSPKTLNSNEIIPDNT